MLYSGPSPLTGFVPGYIVLVISNTVVNGLSTNWIREKQVFYSTGQESKKTIFKWMETIYSTDQIDTCNQLTSNQLPKHVSLGMLLRCWMQTFVMKVCEWIIGTNNVEL